MTGSCGVADWLLIAVSLGVLYVLWRMLRLVFHLIDSVHGELRAAERRTFGV